MRKITLYAAASCLAIAGGVAVVATQVQAQGAPPAGPGMERPGMERPRMDRPGMDRREHGGPMRGMMQRMRQFALIYPAADRALSGPDVQKIAEAFLLFNGNHTWKVTDVAEEPNRVTFAFAAADGTAIAHFAVDRHSGRPERLS